jgi:hypothetical protein
METLSSTASERHDAAVAAVAVTRATTATAAETLPMS